MIMMHEWADWREKATEEIKIVQIGSSEIKSEESAGD